MAGARADVSAAIGPNLPGMFARHGIEPLAVRLFPVSQTLLGPPPASAWQARTRAVEEALRVATSDAASWLGREYLEVLGTYEKEAKEAGSAFVEIQNTMLFATVGQKNA
jgi:hypothetical protein